MNFVADESCAGPVIRALREAGHDVVAIAEVAKGVTDEDVLDRALNEKQRAYHGGSGLRRVGVRTRSALNGYHSCAVSESCASRQTRHSRRRSGQTRCATTRCFRDRTGTGARKQPALNLPKVRRVPLSPKSDACDVNEQGSNANARARQSLSAEQAKTFDKGANCPASMASKNPPSHP